MAFFFVINLILSAQAVPIDSFMQSQKKIVTINDFNFTSPVEPRFQLPMRYSFGPVLPKQQTLDNKWLWQQIHHPYILGSTFHRNVYPHLSSPEKVLQGKSWTGLTMKSQIAYRHAFFHTHNIAP